LIEHADGTFNTDTTYCDGTNAAIISNLYCLIPMSVLRASPYSLTLNTLVAAKVLAHNSRGWSTSSSANVAGASIQTEPSSMTALTSGTTTSSTQIELDWVALTSPNDGYSTILSYGVEWDQGINSFVELLGETSDFTGTTYTITTGITSGTTYQFKIRSKNKWGWGTFSTITTILAASKPSQMNPVTTTIDPTTGGVTIYFTAPSSNGASISAYLI